MILELEDTSKEKHIFDGWNETLIFGAINKKRMSNGIGHKLRMLDFIEFTGIRCLW